MSRDTYDWRSRLEQLELPDPLKAALLQVTGSFVAMSAGQWPAEEGARSELALGRYGDQGALGEGGMGEVRRVLDPILERSLALKAIHPRLGGNETAQERFVAEARLTARLQHPGILPVHELGWLPDGRPYFTLQEVRGQTLRALLGATHRREAAALTIRQLVEAVRRAAEAVGYAHAQGVVHRDLKPDNVMRGPFGEVWVLDWGIAQQLPAAGRIEGTAAYMAPEQARGEPVGPTADVFSLGATLYEVLAGAPPQPGGRGALSLAAKGTRPAAPSERGDLDLGAEFDEICLRALSPEPELRQADAGAFAAELGEVLDGVRRRETALGLVASADAARERADELRQQSLRLAARGRARLASLPAGAPEEERWEGWQDQDRADALLVEADTEDAEADRLLQGALTHASDLEEAHARLASRYLALHRLAEQQGRRAEAARTEVLLRAHGSARHRAYLSGTGALSLVTEPEGAEIVLYRLQERHRRLVPAEMGPLGRTPLEAAPLASGSWLVSLRAPGRREVLYPVHLERGEHWDGIAPGDSEPVPVYLPGEDELGPEDCYVPAGWFIAGRDLEMDAEVFRVPRQRVWCPPFVVRRFVVTNAEYVGFLNELAERSSLQEALRRAPAPPGPRGERTAYARRADGRFALGPDAEGDVWQGDWPVVLIDWDDARAFAEAAAAREGLPWRLGWELEWEKAARGVDGRVYPWGQAFCDTWCGHRDQVRGSSALAPVTHWPMDVSVYGVRGCAGNVCEWVADAEPSAFARVEGGRVVKTPTPAASSRRRMKGGSYTYRPFNCRSDHPGSGLAHLRTGYQGFRLFRDL
jgi:formylglycine-generating enzyme required for sulfatase activity